MKLAVNPTVQYLTGLFFLVFILLLTKSAGTAPISGRAFDPDRALQISQDAVGRTLQTYTLLDRQAKQVDFSRFQGKPLVISLVYTSCYYICSVTTRALAEVVEMAHDALGEDHFNVVTIGFDSSFDKPKTMSWFARQQGVDEEKNWFFLSGDAATIKKLVGNIGFHYVRSPKGFDHLVQATIVDAQGIVYQQVYGEVIPPPQLIEPLKELILGTPPSDESTLDNLVRKVRFYCTTYDPTRDAYRFDYSLFVGLFIGASIILTTAFLLFREIRRSRRANKF